jgi:hypothetical protein
MEAPSTHDPIVLARVGLLVACVVVAFWTAADPDLWGHLRFGQDILAAGSVPRADPYSFTSDRAWVNHEWLSEVAMYLAWRAGGSAGLIILKVAVLASVLLIVFHALRWRLGASVGTEALAFVAMFGLTPRLLAIRPQLFSLVLFAALLALIAAADDGRRRALVAIPLIFLAWVNLHGGWLVGAAVLAIWIGFRLPAPGCSRRVRLELVGTAAASALATLCNPYGIGMWRFLEGTVGLDRADISDWQPMLRMPAAIIVCWSLAVLVAIVVTVRLGRRQDPARLAITALLGYASFRVNRLDAFFALTVVLLLAPQLWRATVRGTATGRAAGGGVQRTAFAAAGAALIVVPAALAMHPQIGCISIAQAYMPEREAGRFILENHLSGRMVTWFSWGEYVIWHAGPRLQVSLDGRRETVYTDRALQANYAFFTAQPGHLDYPVRSHADFVWLPNRLPASAALERQGWLRVFKGPLSSIFARPDRDRRYVQPARAGGAACFPGP